MHPQCQTDNIIILTDGSAFFVKAQEKCNYKQNKISLKKFFKIGMYKIEIVV